MTVDLMFAALSAHRRFGISYWDAGIIEAARSLGCLEVFTEDLQHDQSFSGVRAVNPFM
jgi:predicted nucleic acid-binding protein